MRKIRIIEQMSLDGVIQSPGGREEDGDYVPGGWAMLFFDTAILEAIAAAQGELAMKDCYRQLSPEQQEKLGKASTGVDPVAP